jgi:acyl carrier protein
LVHLEQRYDTRISLEDLDLDNFFSIAWIARFLSSSQRSNGHADP